MSAINATELGPAVRERMQFLARFIQKLASEEIWALLDALFPAMSEETKEDLHDTILASQDGPPDATQYLSPEEFLADLKNSKPNRP